MAEKHIADGEPSFKAASVAPDVCLVGGSAVPFDSFQDLSHEKDYVSTVKARGEHVLTVDSVIAGTQGNAGSGVVSGTSLGSGDCKITSGADSVKAEGKPVARHLSDVSMNNGNTPGTLYTMASAPNGTIQDNKQPCNNPPKRSELLDKLEAFKDGLKNDIFNANRIDQYVTPIINRMEESAKQSIDSIRPGQDSLAVTQGAAEMARGILGFVKDVGLGLVRLEYFEVKQLSFVTKAEENASVAILAENIRLGNVCAELINQQALAAGKEIAKPVTEPWVRGDHIEALTRGALEVGTIIAPLTKIGILGKVAEVAGEVSKGAEVAGEVSKGTEVAGEVSKGGQAAETADVAGGGLESKPPNVTDDVSKGEPAADPAHPQKQPTTNEAKSNGVNIISKKTVGFRREHILNRHRFGSNKPKKTEFPQGWSDDKIIDNVESVANDPNSQPTSNKYGTSVIGEREGVKIRVDFYPDNHPLYGGEISTAYPP